MTSPLCVELGKDPDSYRLNQSDSCAYSWTTGGRGVDNLIVDLDVKVPAPW